MRNIKYSVNETLFTFLLVLVCSMFFSSGVIARDYYATPEGAGNKDGSNWENAISGTDIENIINTEMTGGDRLFLKGNGSYFDDLQITINNGGINKFRPIIIEGVDNGDGYPMFRGSGRSNGVFIYLGASVSYLSIKNLKVEDYKYVVESEEDINNPNEYIIIDGLNIYNVTDGLYLRDFRNSTIKNCNITYHTKRGVRLRTGCRNLEIIDCYTDHNMGDYGNFPSNLFPVGFEVGEGRHDSDSLDQTNIRFIRCEARNCVDDDQSYWNGDGFLVNDKHHKIEFYDCIAYGNADGGWDDKGIGTYYENCISVGNGKNFRNWHSGTYVNCLATNPAKYAEGASGGHTNWWFDGKWGDAVVDLFNCTSHNGSISSTGNDVKIHYAENCIFSESTEGELIASGSGNVFTDGAEPDYVAPSIDFEGHPRDAYNSQNYGPEKGYWFDPGESPLIDEVNAFPDSGDTPLKVHFNVQANDPDGDNSKLSYRWQIMGFDISNEKDFQYTFNIPGEYSIIVNVRDENFLSVSDTLLLTVTGNYPPEVEFLEPVKQQFFFVDQIINIEVDATDRDGSVDSVQLYLDNNYTGTKSSGPYEFSIPGLPEGKYTLMARAYDDDTVFVDDSVKIRVIVPITLYELSWDGSVDLYWEDHLNGVPNDFGELAGYNVYRSTQAGGDYIKINTSIIDTAGYKDNTVINGTKYYYVVTSENTSGNESGFSNEVAAMPQVSVSLDCTDDAYVRDGKYGDNNYGSEPKLIVKHATEDWQRFSYLKFDLSAPGSISRAVLRIKSTDVDAKFHAVKCYLATNDSWSEELINWNNKPDTATLIDITKIPGSQSWIEFDITREVETEISGDGNISLVLLKIEHGNPGYTFHSKEAAEEQDQPMLFITPMDTTSYTISASAGQGGSVNPEGEISVFTGFNQSFNIEPDSGYTVEDVMVDNTSQGSLSKYTFSNVSEAHTINATFTKIPTYTITAIAGDGGSINPEGEMTVYEGDSLNFIIEPENDYIIADVLVDDNSIGAVSDYIFQNISSEHTIEVVFTPRTGLNDINADNDFMLYPNPAKDKIIISSAHDEFDVDVYSIGGTLIKSFRNIVNHKIISTGKFRKEGLYIIKISTDEVVEIKKLIIQE